MKCSKLFAYGTYKRYKWSLRYWILNVVNYGVIFVWILKLFTIFESYVKGSIACYMFIEIDLALIDDEWYEV